MEGDGSSSNPNSRAVQPEKKDFWDSFGDAPKGPANDKKDFWDEFSSVGEQRMNTAEQKKKPSGIGTSAMKKGGAGGPAKKDDEWGEW